MNGIFVFTLAASCLLVFIAVRTMIVRFVCARWSCEAGFEQCREHIFNQYRLTIRSSGAEEQLYHNSMHIVPIPVLASDGSVYHVPWLGFLHRAEVVDISGIWVALDARRISKGVYPEHIRELPKGEYIEGWLVGNGVFAITDNIVAVVDIGYSNSGSMRCNQSEKLSA